MPPLPRIRTQALAELARQLRYESAEAARRQLERTEALALEVLSECGVPGSAAAARAGDRAYPLEYVVFRVTGLRTEGSGEGAMLVGSALLGDLAALIERLSSAAGVTAAELGRDRAGKWVGIEELGERWGVNRKTIERERRRGLIARRARIGGWRGAGALERIMVSGRAVAAFEAAGGRASARRQAGSARLNSGERDRIVAQAARCRSRFGWSLARCAREIGPRHGRSPATITRVLRSHDLAADQAIFAERRAVNDSRRARAGRAARAGAPMAKVAKRLGRSRATGYRIAAGERLRYLRGLELDGPAGPMFDRADAEEVLLAPGCVREGLGAPAPTTVGETVALAEAMGAPDAEVERPRAVAAALLRHGVRAWLGGAGRGARGVGEIRAAEARLLWSSRLRAELVRSQLPVALRSARERLGGRDPRTLAARGPAGGPALIKAMIAGAIDAVERFDPFRGGRLAAATTIAVSRTVGAWASVAGVGPDAVGGRATVRCDSAEIEDWTRSIDPWQARLEPSTLLAEWATGPAENREDARAQRAVSLLYGLDGGPPRSPMEVAALMGTTAARIAAIERAAIARMGEGRARRRRG
ncbi:MAG: hypothetical protein IT438_04885 [Phycisphaerales bacterium]|nr:hypothetical protein [Phycisphaerales bacterium]